MVTETRTSIVDIVLDWCDEAFEDDLKAAAKSAVARLLRQPNGAQQFLEEVGADLIDLLYRQRRIYPERWRAIKHAIPPDGHARGETHRSPANGGSQAPGATEPVRPGLDVPPEPPVYAVWFSVEGRWFVLGDMTRAEADYLERWYAGQSAGYAKRAGFFGRLRDGFQHGEQSVRDRFTPAEIDAIARETGVKL